MDEAAYAYSKVLQSSYELAGGWFIIDDELEDLFQREDKTRNNLAIELTGQSLKKDFLRLDPILRDDFCFRTSLIE